MESVSAIQDHTSMADDEITCQSTTRTNKIPNWCDLPIDMHQEILSRLPLRSVLRWKVVCHSCHSVAKEILETSSSSFTSLAEAPWLLLYRDYHTDQTEKAERNCHTDYSDNYVDDDDDDDNDIDHDEGFLFYNIKGRKFSKLKSRILEKLRHGLFLGMSQGWLLFLNEELEFVLLNPLSESQLSVLPPLAAFPDIVDIEYDIFNIIITCSIPPATSNLHPTLTSFTSLKEFGKKFSTKVVLCSKSTCKSRIFGVMVMYRIRTDLRYPSRHNYNLAFCKTNGNGRTWTKIGEDGGGYADIVSNQNRLYALLTDHTVRVWDFTDSLSPVNQIDMYADATKIPIIHEPFRTYLIKSGEEIFLIWRDWKNSRRDKICAFKLVGLDGSYRWIEVESIGGNSLILDASQAILISSQDAPGWNKPKKEDAPTDSIYFVHKLPHRRSHGLYILNLKGGSKRRQKKKLQCCLPFGDKTPVFLG